MKKQTGLKLCVHLREVADDTANSERAQALTWAAEEIESLIMELREFESGVRVGIPVRNRSVPDGSSPSKTG